VFRTSHVVGAISLITQRFIFDGKTCIAVQKLRIQLGNRIYSFLFEKTVREHKDYPTLLIMRKDRTADRKKTASFAKKVLADALAEKGLTMEDFKQMFDAYKKGNDVYQRLCEVEKDSFKRLEPELEKLPIYSDWLTRVKGIGVKLSVQLLIAVRDIRRFENPSKLCTYMGTAPALKKVRGIQAKFNPEYKGLCLGRISPSLIKSKSQYKRVYDEKKAKYHNEHPDWTKNKCHRYAIKIMFNRFLKELWIAWYRSLGLEPPCNLYIAEMPHHNMEPMIVPYESR